MDETVTKIADHAEVFRGKDGKWYVHTKADNGNVILSSEGYDDREWAVAVAKDTGLDVDIEVG